MTAFPHGTSKPRLRIVVPLLLAALLSTPLATPAARADKVEPGTLWMLRQYRVPACEPMPKVPTVFNWLVRKALAIEEFVAASADCGQIGRRGAREGWTYVFWSESKNTAVERLVRIGQERFGVTALVARKPAESFSIKSFGYEAFIMIQLGGEDGPVRIWSAGDVVELVATISVAAPGELRVQVESTTHDGRSCSAQRLLLPNDPVGSRDLLACGADG